MTASNIRIVTCDRCGAQHQSDRGDDPRWGWLNALRVDGQGAQLGATVGTSGDDLCAACFDALLAWWSEPTGPLPAPPPPPRPTAPALTLEDRKRTIENTVIALRLRTEFVIEVLRHEPTSILSGEILPGALFGIEDTAKGIVDGILDVLRIPVPGERRR